MMNCLLSSPPAQSPSGTRPGENPSPSEAAEELLQRRRARQNLIEFTKFTFKTYVAEPAHETIATTLDKVIQGEIKRLMVFAPPQHGKSELTSVRFPAFWLGKRPDDPIIITSYAASLAESKSRSARELVDTLEYRILFPGTQLRAGSRAVDNWRLTTRGEVVAAGVGGPITGHGALLGIIDDPFENWKQAQSHVMREMVWEWYRTTFRTRVWEDGVIVLIMTRWHEDDLAGRILSEQGERWTVLRLPAIAETQEVRDERNNRMGLKISEPDPINREPGEPLCPKRFSLAALEELQQDVGSLAWNSEYQGSPTAPEGNRFKRGWFTVVDTVPKTIRRRVRYWDKAATAGGGAFTAGVLMSRDRDKIIYIEDMVRGQWSSGQRDAIMLRTAKQDAEKYKNTVRIWTEQEPGSGGKESAESTIKLLSGFPVRKETVTGSKVVRVEPFAAQAEGGNVRLLRGPWNADFIEEFVVFPNGVRKDQVDSCGGAFNKLARGGTFVG